MDTVNTVIAPVNTIEELRKGVADAGLRMYGAEREYAQGLCGILPLGWYLVEHRDTSADAKLVHAEKKALFSVLNAAKHTNPSTVWGRVRKYAQEHVEGVPEATTAEGAADGEAESDGNARHTRSLNLRLVQDLILLWKATTRAESLSDKERQAQTHIASALTALGVDLATIK
jgi:hypothetical protein